MSKWKHIEEYLLDLDGSLRDVIFEHPTWEGVDALVMSLLPSFRVHRATDTEGGSVDTANVSIAHHARQTGHVHLVLDEGNEFVSHLQVFVSNDSDAAPFVEMSFHPNDVLPSNNLGNTFVSWVLGVQRLLGATRCRVGYEGFKEKLDPHLGRYGVFFDSDELDRCRTQFQRSGFAPPSELP